MKFLRVTMPNKAEYDIPVQILHELLAKQNTALVIKQEQPDIKFGSDEYEEVFAEYYPGQLTLICLLHEDQLIDRVVVQLRWAQLADYAVQVTKPAKVNLQTGLECGEKVIIER